MSNCLIIRKGTAIEGNATPSQVLSGATFQSANSDDLQTGTLTLKAEKLAESQSSSSVTLQKDYFAIIVTIGVSGKRTKAGLPSLNTNGLTQLASAGTGNYGYNSSIERDNDYVTQTYIYGSASSGHTISWGSASNGWGHILVLGITR